MKKKKSFNELYVNNKKPINNICDSDGLIGRTFTDSKGCIVEIVTFNSLLGHTFTEVKNENGELHFKVNSSLWFEQKHEQDCCESVSIDDICGDLSDLENSTILIASEDSNIDLSPKKGIEPHDSFTWTFYNIASQKGHVTIKWYGESNGCYSQEAYLYKYLNPNTIIYEN